MRFPKLRHASHRKRKTVTGVGNGDIGNILELPDDNPKLFGDAISRT